MARWRADAVPVSPRLAGRILDLWQVSEQGQACRDLPPHVHAQHRYDRLAPVLPSRKLAPGPAGGGANARRRANGDRALREIRGELTAELAERVDT